MAYVGGKSKGAAHIIKVLNDPKFDRLHYIEPFVGYAHILRRVENKKSYKAYDANPLVVALLKGVQNKKLKYPNITRKQWFKLKYDKKNHSFKRAIAAFTYSFNGVEWSSYTVRSRCNRRENYPAERKRYYDKLRKNKVFMKTKILHKDYKKLKPGKGKLIYCDPPYAGTTGYSPNFNTKEFWSTVRKWSKHNAVFVSEYHAPPDFKLIAKKEKRQSLAGKGAGKKVWEKLFQWKGSPKKFKAKSV
tara:strand:- start:333 stop:1070 length:738 start_codon:yes stop_codon:yes gene_type:complete